jgi:hypothetical protein
MKFSDALVAGSVITESKPYDLNHCALGMAANAKGIARTDDWGAAECRWAGLMKSWPWLVVKSLKFPARVTDILGNPGVVHETIENTPWIWIVETFNQEVSTGKMSFEEFVQKVRGMEPDCGDCCRYECTCVKPTTQLTPENESIPA